MFELFMVGTFWFWALIAAEIILLFMFVEYENGFGATASLLIFGAALQWCGDVDLIGFAFGNPLRLVAVVAAYFLLGGFWGTIKWRIFAKDRLEAYEELRDEFLSDKHIPTGTAVPVEFRKQWKERLERRRSSGGRTLAEAPSARDNKSRIMRWMSFWPVSMLWSFLDDFIKRIFKAIYHRISSFLQRISDNIFAKSTASEDLDIEEDETDENNE